MSLVISRRSSDIVQIVCSRPDHSRISTPCTCSNTREIPVCSGIRHQLIVSPWITNSCLQPININGSNIKIETIFPGDFPNNESGNHHTKNNQGQKMPPDKFQNFQGVGRDRSKLIYRRCLHGSYPIFSYSLIVRYKSLKINLFIIYIVNFSQYSGNQKSVLQDLKHAFQELAHIEAKRHFKLIKTPEENINERYV